MLASKNCVICVRMRSLHRQRTPFESLGRLCAPPCSVPSPLSYVMPHLRTSQVTLTVGFYAGISLIEAGCQSSETDWCGGVALMEYAVRSLIMLSTVVAINFNITHIRFCIQVTRKSDGEIVSSTRQGTLLRVLFRVVVIRQKSPIAALVLSSLVRNAYVVTRGISSRVFGINVIRSPHSTCIRRWV